MEMNNTTTPEETEYKEAQDCPSSAFVVPLAQFLEMKQQRDEARELLASEKITRNHIIKRSVEVERERDEAREQLAGIENKMRGELGGHPNSKLWGESGLIAATMRCVHALGKVTDERDGAREENTKLRDIADKAIDYLDQSYRDGFADEASELRYQLAQLKEGAT